MRRLPSLRISFPVCVHMILNLPGDTMEDARESARILSALPVSMVKLHSLYIPKKSVLYQEYRNGRISICAKEEYLERMAEFIALLRPDIAVERLFARIPEKDSAFCNWGHSWWKLTDEWTALMKEKQYVQGVHCDYFKRRGIKQMGIIKMAKKKGRKRLSVINLGTVVFLVIIIYLTAYVIRYLGKEKACHL